jgi:Rrf2 family iron-sulfur cluster assembly transcriptional regulator
VCLTHQLWEDLSDRIHAFLSNITLADLVARPHVQEVASRQEGRMQAAAH